MDLKTIVDLIPIAGKIGVVSLLLLWIYSLNKDKQELKKNLTESIESHLRDMRESKAEVTDFADKFNSFANEIKDIVLRGKNDRF